LVLVTSARSQTFDATSLRQPAELGTTWLIHTGDEPAWAQTSFNDANWTHFDSRTDIKATLGSSRPDVVWYRLHVKVAPTQTGLALLEHQISSAFEVYVDGQRLIQTGQIAPFVPYTFGARLLAPIPNEMLASGSFVIAIRVHFSRLDWDGSGPGFAAENLTIGQESALRDHIWLTSIGEAAPRVVVQIFGLGLGIVALALFSAQRRQLEYLWIFLQFFATVLILPSFLFELTHNIPTNWDLLKQPVNIAESLFEILMYIAFLRLRFKWWMGIACGFIAAGLAVSWIGQAQGSISQNLSLIAQAPQLILIAVVLPIILIRHRRLGNREAGILIIPALLTSLNVYVQVIDSFLFKIPALHDGAIRWYTFLFIHPAGPFILSLNQLCSLLYILSLAIIMVLRATRMSRQQALLEGEMAAAREVQQVILPEKFETFPGFTVESVYQPAKQVGGDFFQVLPDGQGGILLFVGDVAGKGLPAAMLVSVIVGAIRSSAEYTGDPAELLANLNERLIGRTQGSFSTALVAHIASDGYMTIANAGHLSPYLDGIEIDLPGALPLGILSGTVYETRNFHLPQGSRLTFYSDGVIEAQNSRGELLGFERGRELSTQSAVAIVKAAELFGQSDDITVVAITRHAAIAQAA
jgi:hypothetical protein